jgi:hypothetical protein
MDANYTFDNIVLSASDEVPLQLRRAWKQRHTAEVCGRGERVCVCVCGGGVIWCDEHVCVVLPAGHVRRCCIKGCC